MCQRIASTLLAIALLLAVALPLKAQQYEKVGDYQVHYSAVSTQHIPQAVAETHGIQRSPALALLNVSVLEELDDGETRPINAGVEGTVGMLQAGERTPLAFRTLRSGDSPSQVAVFRIRDDAPMHFELEVRYDRNREPAAVNFIQRFHIER
ncbi:DUF4426 domain-containing protein [Billgrantia saliphila]|uniref:DUF4426 domain-containing protein n=1 Tax=Billgrantia saliphila TaxID=1848458 RepID=UPI000CE4EAE6|nr:DUF4426 domain-containing protein [Halomonas saliphila]